MDADMRFSPKTSADVYFIQNDIGANMMSNMATAVILFVLFWLAGWLVAEPPSLLPDRKP
jgi:hypothetical protein